VHVDGNINPLRDIETINLELIFADLETVEKRLDKANKMLKSDKKYQIEINALLRLKEALDNGKSARTVEISDEEKEFLKDLFLLTSKPIIYISNVSEEQLADAESDDNVKKMKAGDTVYLTANLPHKVQLPKNCSKAKALTFYASQELRKTADL
jgi:ribosome-binding ATPase YchF (GTP1/OBG family)